MRKTLIVLAIALVAKCLHAQRDFLELRESRNALLACR
jgi:hypothetical protein